MFIDARFPVTISYGSVGGPKYRTSIVASRSGMETRNIDWVYPQHEYDASTGVNKFADIEDLIAFFHVVKGRAHTFRWKDWADYKSCSIEETPSAADQVIGTGDGIETQFQLVKNYSFGSQTNSRRITKPVAGTILVALDGVSTSSFSTNVSTGIVTLTSPPGTDVVITAGYEFDVHCRLDVDSLSTNLTDYRAGSVQIPVIEVKEE